MRSKPGFEPDSYEAQYQKQDSPGCILMLVVMVGGYFVFSAINKVLSGYGNKLDQYVCYGTLICLVILFALGPHFKEQEKKKLRKARQEWKRTCKSADVAIMNRSSYGGGSYEDEYGIPHRISSYNRLELGMTTDQREAAPKLLTTISVYVYSNIYEKLEKRETVRIYYKPESPMTFLLEEEF